MTKESAPPYSIFLTDEDLNFPDVSLYRGDTPIAYGYGISTEQILRAYNLGIFPWPNSKGLVFWMSPDPRAVIFPDKFRISRSLKKTIQREVFTHQIDTDFLSVIHYCAAVPRPGQNGTWINRDIIKAYTALHQIGRVHSFETYQNGKLTGGLYGVCVGDIFVGESMFSLVPEASKYALAVLVSFCRQYQIKMIDCQIQNPHLASMGAEEIPRREYMEILNANKTLTAYYKNWDTPGKTIRAFDLLK